MKGFLQKPCGPFYQGLARFWNWLTAPSASVTEVGMRRQAQFLAALALLVLVLMILQVAVAATTGRMPLAIMLAVLLLGVIFIYGFSRSPFPQWGAVFFVYGFAAFAFVLSSRETSDVATTLYGMIPVVYLLSGALLAIGWQVALVSLVFVGCIGLRMWQPIFAANGGLVTGNLTALGVVLVVTSMLRDGIERRRLDQVRQINRELEVTHGALDRERNLLLDSEARTRALLAAIPDMIFELSRDGVFMDFIPSQGPEPSLPSERFLGRSVTEIMPPEIAAASLRAVQQALAGAGVQMFEYQLPLGDALRGYEARVVASRPDTALAIVRDITERKQAETERERLIQELEKRNAELERFIYTVSHDLKSPLITIGGFWLFGKGRPVWQHRAGRGRHGPHQRCRCPDAAAARRIAGAFTHWSADEPAGGSVLCGDSPRGG